MNNRNIEATIVADSINPSGKRITSFLCTYPRFIHCFKDDTEFLSQIGDELPQFRSFNNIRALGIK